MKNTRQTANRTLLFLFIIFLFVYLLKFTIIQNSWIDFLLFIIEAALIGGIADWFAVTALFTYPLGIKLPHTALIPNNRQKVISSLVTLIQDELLSTTSLKKYLSETKITKLTIQFIDQHMDFIIEKGTKFILIKLKESDHNSLGLKIEEIIKKQLKNIPLTSIILETEKTVTQHNFLNFLWDRGIDFVIAELPHTNLKQNISRYLWKLREEQISKYTGIQGLFRRAVISLAEQTNTLNISDATDVIYKEIERAIIDLKLPNHQLRKEIERNLFHYLQQFKENEQWQREVEEWKDNLINELDLHTPITQFLSTVNNESAITQWTQQQVKELWLQFKENELIQHKVEKYCKAFLITFIDQEHHKIGYIVEEILQTFTDEDLVQFIEDKVGEDLQWIRINGSILGSVVGAMLYLFLNYIYTPLLNLF